MIEVVYFDLGKVIVDFDHSRAAQELLKVTPLSLKEAMAVLSDGELVSEYETGRLSSQQHYRKVCRRLQMEVSIEKFRELWGSMFLPEPLLSESFLQDLKKRYRLMLLSNTNEIHFDFVIVNNRRISDEQAERYAAEGAYQIGIHDSINDALDQTTEIVRADLLNDGEKVRHNSDRLAEVVLNCRKQALAPVVV